MATQRKVRSSVNSPYQGPYGRPVAHVHYQEGRHLDPERLPFYRHETPVSLRLLDVSKESLENVKKVAASLKRLLAPSLKLKTVPESLVAYLDHLERLDLGHNNLTDSSFPEVMKSLELLVELRLNDNQLTRVPPCLKRMRSLARLDLSDNEIDSAAGLERLKKLQFLVLDNNNLTSVFKEINGLRKLEMLRCSSNNLRDVPRDVRNLRHLKDLDLSNNRIAVLPTDVFQLPSLECLNASQNQVAKIPSFNVKTQNRHWITSVDLSDNNLVKFPGHLMNLAYKLDLTSNKIRNLSWAALKKVDLDRDQELLLHSNPLCYPPQDVCESGLKTILQFFQESQADVKTYQGVKVLVTGAPRSGKSSLIHSLVDQQGRLSEEMAETQPGIDAYEMSFDYDVEEGKPGKSLNLCLWDLSGDPFYLYPHYVFQEQPSVTVVTFSIPDYKPHLFLQQVGSWFDWMIAKTNKLVVILVATKADRVSPKKATQITREVRDKLAAHLQKRHTMIQSRIQEIEKRPVISPTLSEQLKAYMKLLKAKFTVQTEVIATSSKEFTGFDKLREAIEALANDRKLFPNVMRVIPTFWVEVENWVEERGNALVVPVMRWEEFSDEVTERFGMKHLLNSITQYLHESGKVLWFSNCPALKELVFLRPSWLFDVLKQVFRHDLESLTFTPDESLKAIAFTAAKFERLKPELVSEGVLDRELLKGLLVSLMPADVNQHSMEVMKILTQGLEIGYLVSKRPRDKAYTFQPDKDSEGNPKIQKLLIPWYRTCAEPTPMCEEWAGLGERRHVAVFFQFPCYMPPGVFELMTVRTRAEKHNLTFLAHWGGGIHARHNVEKIRLMMMYFREGVSRADDDDDVDDGDNVEDEMDGKGKGSDDKAVKCNGNKGSEVAAAAAAAKPKSRMRPQSARERRVNFESDFDQSRQPSPQTSRQDSSGNKHDDSSDTGRNNNNNSSNNNKLNNNNDTTSVNKRKQLRHLEQDLSMPDTIQELDEEEAEENMAAASRSEGRCERGRRGAGGGGGSGGGGHALTIDDDEDDDEEDGDRQAANGAKGFHLNDRTVNNSGSMDCPDSGRWALTVDRPGHPRSEREDEKSETRKTQRRRRRPTECEGDDDGSVIVRFEIRDNSEDATDQTPASSMWNVLLPLLTDFEELLQAYTGVLVERGTECPLCGAASFLGEWQTPKETQGLNTRPCESCGKHVDTAFLVQPREKKRDEVMRSIIRRSVRRRCAAVTSDIADMQRVAPLNPRRAALLPLDIGDGGLRRLLGHRDSSSSEDL